MSIDRSLRTGGGLSTKRSVLKRTERVEKTKQSASVDYSKKPVLGIPKTRVH